MLSAMKSMSTTLIVFSPVLLVLSLDSKTMALFGPLLLFFLCFQA